MVIGGLLFSFTPPISSEYRADSSLEEPIGAALLLIASHMNIDWEAPETIWRSKR
jgi:hypothetical protein